MFKVWYDKGLKEFTKAGYEVAAKRFESLEKACVKGRSFMITGANGGIGRETALAVAKSGGTVHMVCRNEKTGRDAYSNVVSESGNADVNLHILDLSLPANVHSFAKSFVSNKTPLNVLVNNAGAIIHNKEYTADNLEMNFAVNALGPYILTTTLIGHMKNFQSPQVMTVTAGGVLTTKLDFKDLQYLKKRSFKGKMAYMQNKRQLMAITEQLAKDYPNIQFTTMHPGWADTSLVQNAMPDFRNSMASQLRSPLEAADTLIWLCLSEAARKEPSGGFYQDRETVPKHFPKMGSSDSEEMQLMEELENVASQFRS